MTLHSYALAVHTVKVSGIILELCSEVVAMKVKANARLVRHVVL